jgi:folate-binding protein YgfZ
MTQPIPSDYLAAKEGAVFQRPPDPGFLLLAGEDRLDFLQRLTSNDLRLLGPGRSLRTVLTSPTARILDLLTLVEWGEALAAITLAGRGQRTGRELRGKIFFMDRVTVADAAAVEQAELDGPAAGEILRRLGLAAPGRDETLVFERNGARVQVIARPGLCGPGYRLLASPPTAGERREDWPALLAAAGALPLDAANYQALRIEAGLPGPEGELTDAFNPLEVGLDELISERKGCYTGQEIIARQISYDKVTRRLVGLRLEAPSPVGARLEVDEKQVGEITSAAVSPLLGPIALAVVRRPHNEPGTRLRVVSPAATGAATGAAAVTPLPFPAL